MLRILTFIREPEAMFWTFGFPIIMAIGLGLAFQENPDEPVIVAVESGSAGVSQRAALARAPEIDVRVLGAGEAERALRKGDVAMVLAGEDSLVYRFDPTRPESRLARLVVDRAVQGAAG